MKRMIVDIDDELIPKIQKELSISNKKIQILDIYEPLSSEIPVQVEKVRNALNELKDKGYTMEIIRNHIVKKYNVKSSDYDRIMKGLGETLNLIYLEHKIKELKK